MGFVVDTPITTNADALKYAFEQQLVNLLRGANTYDELHKGAVNTLIAEELEPKGYTTPAALAAITNTTSFKPAVCYWVLHRIMLGQAASVRGEAARQDAEGKADRYRALYRESIEKVVILTSDGKARSRRGLPVVVNVDGGTSFPALGSGGEVARGMSIAREAIQDFDGTVIEGK